MDSYHSPNLADTSIPTIELIRERWEDVKRRISRAAENAGRVPADVTLVVVTKTWSLEVLLNTYQAGIRDFGENRPEELSAKRAEVEKALGPNSDIVWHLIGPLQSRKTTIAADSADQFHALDRMKIARRMSAHLQDAGKELPVFLEVNISGEVSKAGFDCSKWEDDQEQRNQLHEAASEIAQLPGLRPMGLMTMAPWIMEEQRIRKIFRRTRLLAGWLQETMPMGQWSSLSMGMTDDFEIAVEEGATHVRIGRAILGARRGGD